MLTCSWSIESCFAWLEMLQTEHWLHGLVTQQQCILRKFFFLEPCSISEEKNIWSSMNSNCKKRNKRIVIDISHEFPPWFFLLPSASIIITATWILFRHVGIIALLTFRNKRLHYQEKDFLAFLIRMKNCIWLKYENSSRSLESVTSIRSYI